MKDVNSSIAYEYIRKRILNGEYPPGRPLLTNFLASQVAVSRTPVREALRQLEVDGLVTIRPHLGASVKAMELRELRDLCELRLALESHAAGLAARHRTEDDLGEIKRALEAMRVLTDRIIAGKSEQPLIGDLMSEDVHFHVSIITAAKNGLIKKEILRLHLINRIVSSDFRAPDRTEGVTEKEEKDIRRRAWLVSHEAIYDAIARQDAPAAKSAMEDHIQGIIDNSIRRMARSESGLIARQLTEEELSYTT